MCLGEADVPGVNCPVALKMTPISILIQLLRTATPRAVSVTSRGRGTFCRSPNRQATVALLHFSPCRCSHKGRHITVILHRESKKFLLEHGHFWNTDTSQGSVATHWRCGGIFKYEFVANIPLSLPLKEFWKSVNISGSYGQEFSVLFFWLTVYKRNRVSSPVYVLPNTICLLRVL